MILFPFIFWLMALSLPLLAAAVPPGPFSNRSDDPYLAPFREGDPAGIVPNHYYIGLEKNYTLQEHWINIGMNLSEVGTEFGYWEFRAFNAYSLALYGIDDEEVIQKVRRDPGVMWVDRHNTVPQIGLPKGYRPERIIW